MKHFLFQLICRLRVVTLSRYSRLTHIEVFGQLSPNGNCMSRYDNTAILLQV